MSQRQYIHITPSNQPANSVISYKAGIPLVVFTIGEQERYLLGKTIRLNGKFRLRKGIPSASNPVLEADKVSLDSRLGIMSVIDQLTISSKRTNATMEQIRHYGRFLSSYQAMTNGPNDFIGHYSGMFNSTGDEEIDKRLNVYQSAVGANAENLTSFSMPLLCGLFTGDNPIPLSTEWGVQGVQITINLANDMNCLQSAVGVDAFYELSDLHLTAEVSGPNGDEQASGTFMYNTISSFYDVVSASYSTINFNLGLSRVLGAWINFIKAKDVNNPLVNGYSTLPIANSDGTPAPLKRVAFLRGGVKFPLQYELDSYDTPIIGPELLRNYINAISTFTKLSRTCISVENTNNFKIGDVHTPFSTNGGAVFGIGCAYDQISGVGADFSSQQMAVIMECDLTTIGDPYGAYMFVHAKAALQYGPAGIMVHT